MTPRQVNGPHTTGRDYRNLSDPEHHVRHDVIVGVPMRDGTSLMADVHRPDSEGLSCVDRRLALPPPSRSLREGAYEQTVRNCCQEAR